MIAICAFVAFDVKKLEWFGYPMLKKYSSICIFF